MLKGQSLQLFLHIPSAYEDAQIVLRKYEQESQMNFLEPHHHSKHESRFI